MPCCKQKYRIKSMAVKIPILIFFRFCLLCYLSPFSAVAASCFNFMDPCRWLQLAGDGFSSFQIILGHFRSFQIILVRFRLFQIVPHFNKYTAERVAAFNIHQFKSWKNRREILTKGENVVLYLQTYLKYLDPYIIIQCQLSQMHTRLVINTLN